jgi:NaMN:DMB phosphoribosyltransferase
VRLASSKKVSDSEILASLGQSSSRSSEYLVIAAGGVAMLLVVALCDLFGLLS